MNKKIAGIQELEECITEYKTFIDLLDLNVEQQKAFKDFFQSLLSYISAISKYGIEAYNKIL